MKTVLALFVLVMSAHCFGAEATFSCNLHEGKSGHGEVPQEKQIKVDTSSKESFKLIFGSRVSNEVRIEGRYSPILNSVDSEITDLRTGQRSMATDWFNEKGKGASASLVVNTRQKESFILQCVKYPE
jgi:hypothetical protein